MFSWNAVFFNFYLGTNFFNLSIRALLINIRLIDDNNDRGLKEFGILVDFYYVLNVFNGFFTHIHVYEIYKAIKPRQTILKLHYYLFYYIYTLYE